MVRLAMVLLPVAMLIHATIANPPINPKPLSNIFQVDLRDPSVHTSSCLRNHWAPPNKESDFVGKPIFDRSKEFEDRDDNILNNIWYQTWYMVWFARAMLEQYNTDHDIAQLVYSFWGIKSGRRSGSQLVGTPQGVYLHKYELVKGRLEVVQDYMETDRADGPDKYKIFCGGEYFEKQEADDWYKDNWGRTVDNPSTGTPWKLAEWERAHGRDFDAHWYFWYDIETMADRGYYVMKNDEFDWALNPSTNKYTTCTNRVHAVGLLPYDLPAAQSGGTESWFKGGHLILCPSGFYEDSPYDNLEQYPLGTKLETVGIAAITFLHEMIHVVFPDDSWDQIPWLPMKNPNVPSGTVSADWPYKKSAFTQARYPFDAFGPLHAWSLAMYEVAEPETMDINHMVSWRTPEVYAWFARTAHLMAIGRQDWSTGVARDLEGDFEGPIALPPHAKRTAIPGDARISMRDFWTTLARRFEAGNTTTTALSR